MFGLEREEERVCDLVKIGLRSGVRLELPLPTYYLKCGLIM